MPVSNSYDVVIVGGGLAGACAALTLCTRYRVGLLEADRPASGASGAAAGLVNPLMARKARLIWRYPEAHDALLRVLDDADASALFHPSGVLRPARDEKQAAFFRDSADAYPAYARWLAPAPVRDRYPAVLAPFGALEVHAGGHLNVQAFVQAVVKAAVARGLSLHLGTRLTHWTEAANGLRLTLQDGSTLSAGRLVLAPGYGFRAFPPLSALNLHGVKGQTIRVSHPVSLGALPCVSGEAYIVPDADGLIVGSTYEHRFSDLRPSPEQSVRLLKKAASVVPGLRNAEIQDAFTGVRVTVPGTRLPMVGPLPGQLKVWIFTGLGSKGVLMAPLLARALPSYFGDASRIPPEVRTEGLTGT